MGEERFALGEMFDELSIAARQMVKLWNSPNGIELKKKMRERPQDYGELLDAITEAGEHVEKLGHFFEKMVRQVQVAGADREDDMNENEKGLPFNREDLKNQARICVEKGFAPGVVAEIAATAGMDVEEFLALAKEPYVVPKY